MVDPVCRAAHWVYYAEVIRGKYLYVGEVPVGSTRSEHLGRLNSMLLRRFAQGCDRL